MKKQKILSFGLVAAILSVIGTSFFAYTAEAAPAAAPAGCEKRFLTLPPWYRGLVKGGQNGDCEIVSPDDVGGLEPFVQILALNIVEILLHIVAYVTIAFIIIGGFKYITSAGSPDGNEKGRKTIINAVIGLLISIASIGIVNVVVSGTNGGTSSGTTTQQTTAT